MSKWLRALHAIVVGVIAIALLVVAARPADAGTGGRMGGGSWGSSRSSSSSSSSRSSSSSSSSSWHSSPSSSSSSYSYSSTNYHYSGGGGYYGGSSYSSSGGFSFGFIVIIVIAIIVIAFAINMFRNANATFSSYDAFAGSTTGGGNVDVTVLRVVIDGRSRKFVQTELARIAKVADTGTSEGRAAMLREVSVMLRRLKDAWIYGGAVNEEMSTETVAKQKFDRHVDDARARFREETIANVQGTQQGTATTTEYTPHGSEGAGVILVSIIIAAYNELYTVSSIGDGEDLRKALESAAYRDPNDLIAIEIIWEPSEDNDRMSSMELEAKYPAPQLIKITGALAGKVFCEYCSGPFPCELLNCPHCGAAGPKAAAMFGTDRGKSTG